MKKLTIGVMTVGMMLLGGFSATAAAQSATQEEVTDHGVTAQVIEKGATHEGALYAASGALKVDGTVNGSVYCAVGAELEIRGTVHGDVVCVGSRVSISGTVTQDARLAGSDVVIDGKIGGDASVAALKQIKIGKTAQLGGELQVYGDAVGIDGVIGKNAYLSATSLSVGASAKFMGDVQYIANQEHQFTKDQVQGEVLYHQAGYEESSVATTITFAIMLILLAMFVAIIAPRFVERSSVIAREKVGLTLLVGIAVVFFTPIVAVIALLTIVAAPIAIVLAVVYVGVLLLSGAFFAYFLGSLLFKQSKNILIRMLGGVVFLAALLVLPVINIVAFIAALVMGTGIAVRTLTHNYKTPRYSLKPPAEVPPLPGTLEKSTTNSSKTGNTVKSTTKNKTAKSDTSSNTARDTK